MKKIVLYALEILGTMLTHLGSKWIESRKKGPKDAQD